MTSGTFMGNAQPGNTYPALIVSGAIYGRVFELRPWSKTTLQLFPYSKAGN